MNSTSFTHDQVKAIVEIDALIKFIDVANSRPVNKHNTDRVLGYVFDHMHHEPLIRSIVQKGVTDLDEIKEKIIEAENNPPLSEGSL